VGVGGVPVQLLFIVCYCFLFWIGCVSSDSAIIKSDLLCSVVTEYCSVRKCIKLFYLLFFARRLPASSCSSGWASVPL